MKSYVKKVENLEKRVGLDDDVCVIEELPGNMYQIRNLKGNCVVILPHTLTPEEFKIQLDWKPEDEFFHYFHKKIIKTRKDENDEEKYSDGIYWYKKISAIWHYFDPQLKSWKLYWGDSKKQITNTEGDNE